MPNIGVASPAITAGQSADTGSRLTVTGWILPALVTFFLGVYNIRTPELWRDEISSWNMATRSLPQLLATFRHTNAADLRGVYRTATGWVPGRPGGWPGLRRDTEHLAVRTRSPALCTRHAGRRTGHADAAAGACEADAFALGRLRGVHRRRRL